MVLIAKIALKILLTEHFLILGVARTRRRFSLLPLARRFMILKHTLSVMIQLILREAILVAHLCVHGKL